jgi:hypothetical protein
MPAVSGLLDPEDEGAAVLEMLGNTQQYSIVYSNVALI